MTLLPGIHDREGRHLVPAGGWCLDLIALSENPAPTNYTQLKPDLNWIVRANWGYGSTGTIPTPDRYEEMARRLARYVEQSPGCHIWIIGNEPNLSREWPNGQPIHPIMYAECYLDCRHAIHALPGHEHDEVLIAGPGPWNDEFKYPGNEFGDWVVFFEDVQEIVGDECDGFSLHGYTHGYDTALVTSEARMDAAFAHRRYEFRVYRDFAEAVRPELRHLPIYLTEANGNGPWQAVGLMPAMLEEISLWNASGGQGIRCLIFYRFPEYDQGIDFSMEGKADVIAEFQAAMQRSYTLPKSSGAVTPPNDQQFLPSISTGETISTPPSMARDIDPRALYRGVKIETPPIAPGQLYWAVETIRFYDEEEADGLGPDHHMMIDALDESGQRVAGLPLLVTWGSGSEQIYTERKPNEPYSANKPLTPGDFAVAVNDGLPSEKVTGVKMGEMTEQGWNPGIHTTHGIVFRRRKMPQASQPIPQPEPSHPAKVPALAHPVADPRYRVVTQVWGVNGEYYKRFAVDGVPLKGHNGIDFGTPEGTEIVAVDEGYVIESAYDPEGFGEYVKLGHVWGESLYAHLSHRNLLAGRIGKGGQIGRSGYTGNVRPPGPAGAHLHFGLRITPYNRQDGWGGYLNPAPYLINVVVPSPAQPTPSHAELIAITQAAAAEFGVDWRLLASLIQAESSYDPHSVNEESGAAGLGNFMPLTWSEWSAKVGARDIFNATDNSRATAAYLAWCVKTAGNLREGLWAYNWGIGNVLEGKTMPPTKTIEYANKILYGVDLLNVVGVGG